MAINKYMRGMAPVLLAGLVTTADAVQWDIEPSVYAAATYTDNVQLSPESMADGDLVSELMPGIELTATGKKFQAEFDYRLQGLFYADRSEFNETLHYGRTEGTVNLLGDSLFLDFNGARGQQIINPAGRIGISTVSASGNRTEVSRLNVSPYFQRELGKTSEIRVAYNFGLVDYDIDRDPLSPAAADRLNDSTSNGVTVTISGNPPGSPLSWRIDGARTRIDYDTGPEPSRDVRLQRIGAELSWLFSNRLTVFASGGDENNEFNRIGGASKIDGAFWYAGMRGKLDRVTNYMISVGEQHFGDSLQFSLQRNAKLLSTNLSYLEETTTVGQQQTGYEALFQFLSQVTGVELPTPGISVYVRKRLALDATLELAQSRARLNLYSEDRDYLTPLFAFDNSEGDTLSDGVLGAALSWTWTALPRTDLSVDLGWQRFNLRADSNNPEDIRLQFRLNRDLRDNLSVNASAWRNVRSATIAPREYEENAISVGIRKSF